MTKKKAPVKTQLSFLSRLDEFTEKHLSKFFTASIILTVVLGFYHFQMRISEGGDDSFYIKAAKDFLEGETWPGWHGPFYPIFLSWIMAIFGFKIFAFKFTSYLFLIGSQILFFHTFKKKIPSTILVIALLLMSVCSELLYFGSQTYTEAIYLFLQSALFFFVIRYYLEMRDGLKTGIEHWWVVLCVGLILFLLSITRNIGIVALGVILFYLLIEKKFFLAGYTLAGFLVFRLPFSLYKKIAWDVESANMQGQLSEILLKNPYNRSLGTEDFGGMVDRFLENSEIYLSRLLMVASGLRSPDYSETSAFFTILLYLIFALAIYMAFKHSKVMKFTGIYLGLAIAATFVALQQQWGQMRMVIIYVPLVFLFLPWGLLEATKPKKVRGLQPVIVILLLVMFFNLFGLSVKRAQDNKVALMKNLRGDRYYGYTPDWVNFLKMSEWAAENVPEESMIASRKPSMSFIYGDGRSFYGVYRFPSMPADTVLSRMAEKTSRPIVVNERELSTGGIPRQMVLGMRRGVESFMSVGDSMYSVYFFPDEARDGFISMLEQYDVRYDTDLDILNRKLAQSGKPGLAVVPDTLVNMLLRNNVDYMIRGSLRLNPAQKTERVINTVHRYMYYMEQKYPGIFSQVSQVGGNNDEPAYLFRIHWDRFGLGSPPQ